MNIKDYANDVNLSVAEIIKRCQELGIKANSETELTDDDIILLDNTLNLISTDTETTYEEEDVIDDVVMQVMESENIDKSTSNSQNKQKLKKKDSIKESKDFKNLKKEMYKHKSKLMGNSKEKDVVLYTQNMTVSDLANALEISSNDMIKKLMGLGLMLNVNQTIDFENAEIVALDYGKTLKKEESQDISNFENYEVIDNPEDLVERPPIVTIMGHVDHGKTTLLDYIRNSNIVSGEAGGITQAIGAYQITHNDKKITFIDTPGHAAFTQMRARGAAVTDIVIIIVAANDGVMPQTKEAVDHALSANVPIIVAVNKIDLPDTNIERVYTEMAELSITPESWGGDVPFINISAKTGEGIDTLLETILAISEVKELKANPNRYATGTVIEARSDRKVGSVVSLLVQSGTLRIGDPVVIGTSYGKIRGLKDDKGNNIAYARPSTPVEVIGISELPTAGDKFMAFATEKEARSVSEERKLRSHAEDTNRTGMSLDELFNMVQEGTKEINVVLKTDVKGSEEAVKHSLSKIDVEGVKVKVIRSGVGNITESDVSLASASNAIIIGFNVRPDTKTSDLAKDKNVEIRLYNIIYKVVEDMEDAIKGSLEPVYEEQILGTAEVRKIFKFSKIGNIAGCHVTDGLIKNGAEARLIRDGVVVYTSKIASLQHEKDQVKEAKNGFDCGITIADYQDIREGDLIECYQMVEVKR